MASQKEIKLTQALTNAIRNLAKVEKELENARKANDKAAITDLERKIKKIKEFTSIKSNIKFATDIINEMSSLSNVLRESTNDVNTLNTELNGLSSIKIKTDDTEVKQFLSEYSLESSRLVDAQKLLAQTNPFDKKALQEANKELENATSSYESLVEQNQKLISSIPELANRVSLITNSFEGINKSLQMSKSSFKELTDDITSMHSEVGDLDKVYKKMQASITSIGRIEMSLEEENFITDFYATINRIAKAQEELLNVNVYDEEGQKLAAATLQKEIGLYEQLIQSNQTLINNNSKLNNGIVSFNKSLTDSQKEIEIIVGLTEEERKVYSDLISDADQLKEKFITLGNQITTALKKPSLAIGLLIRSMGGLVTKFGEVNKQLGTGFDLTKATAQTTLLSFFFDDAVDTFKQLSTELGSVERATGAVATNTNLLANNLGMSGSDMAKLVGSFARVNNNSTDMAQDLIVSTREFAKMRGVNPNLVMQDLADNTELFALFAKEGGKNLQDAAVYAKQLGVGLDSVGNIANSLLDFESSLNSELQLSAMLGRQINLDRARALAFEGDLSGAVQETVKQLGGVAGYEAMNVLQRKEAAQALGLSVSEFEKLMKNQETANTQQSMLNKKFNKGKEIVTGIANTWGGDVLKGLGNAVILAGQFGLGIQGLKGIGGAVKTGIGSVKGFFGKAKGMTEAFPGAKVGRDASGKFTSIGKNVNEVGKAKPASPGIGKGLKSLAGGLRAMGDPKVLFGALNLIPTALGFVAILPGLPGMLGVSLLGVGAGTGVGALGKGLKTMGTPQVALGALNLVLAALAFTLMTAGSIGLAVIALGGVAAAAGLTALAGGLTSFGASAPVSLIGIGLLALLGAALIPLTYSLSLLVPIIDSFGKIIIGVLSSVPPIINSIADGLVKMLGVITLEKAGAMYALAGGLGVLALALGGFALALAGAGIGGLLGGGILSSINELAEKAEPLNTVSNSLTGIASSIQSIGSAVETLNLEKLQALQEFEMKPQTDLIGGIAEGISKVVGTVTSLVVGEPKGESTNVSDYQNQMLQKLDNLITATNTNRDVYLDGNKVTEFVISRKERSGLNRFGLGKS